MKYNKYNIHIYIYTCVCIFELTCLPVDYPTVMQKGNNQKKD